MTMQNETQESNPMEQPKSGTRLRGFASMSKERQKAIASKGGRAAHEKGTAHEFNSAEAATAAKTGHLRGTAHEFTREEARIAGRKGGLARAQNRLKLVTEASSAPNAMESSGPEGRDAGSQSFPNAG